MILTDILTTTEDSTTPAPLEAHSYAEVERAMRSEGLNECRITLTFMGDNAISKTVTLDEIKRLIRMEEYGESPIK